MSPLLAQSGHPILFPQCPLLGVKRTSQFDRVMSAFDPKRTFVCHFQDAVLTRYDAASRARGKAMRRRQFIAALGSTALAWSLPARSQQSQAVARIGLLQVASLASAEGQANFEAFRQGLVKLGYIEGQNIVIDKRSADGFIGRLPTLVTELINLKVDVIVTGSTASSLAAKQATNTIPIVGVAMGDPVQDGLVASLARPNGNITGTTFLGPELVPKRLAVFKELLPSLSRVSVLWHPGAFAEQTTNDMLKQVTETATELGLQLQLVEVRNPNEFERAFSDMTTGQAEGMFEFPSPMFFSQRARLVELAARQRLPAIYNAREFVQIGGLIAYGASISETYRNAASYVDKILKGAKPADLPIEQPTRFELYINRKTARVLGISIPQTLLATADDLIE
jgi:putative tryptophan/tyrosine transport system substrate-binding protein